MQVRAIILSCVLAVPGVSAAAELVVVVGARSGVTALPAEQAAQIFLGKSVQFTPVNLPEGAPLRDEFYKKATGRDGSQVKAIWSKLIFTGKATVPKEYGSSADVVKAVATDPKLIGYVDKTAVNDTVKVVLSVQ